MMLFNPGRYPAVPVTEWRIARDFLVLVRKNSFKKKTNHRKPVKYMLIRIV